MIDKPHPQVVIPRTADRAVIRAMTAVYDPIWGFPANSGVGVGWAERTYAIVVAHAKELAVFMPKKVDKKAEAEKKKKKKKAEADKKKKEAKEEAELAAFMLKKVDEKIAKKKKATAKKRKKS